MASIIAVHVLACGLLSSRRLQIGLQPVSFEMQSVGLGSACGTPSESYWTIGSRNSRDGLRCGGITSTTELGGTTFTTVEPATAPAEERTTTTVGPEAVSGSDWLSAYGGRFEQALSEAGMIMLQLRGGPTQAECQDLQDRSDPVDQELNELIDLLPSEMTTLGDALYVAVGDVSIALSFCALGETGAPLQQQLDLYDLDRRTLSDVAEIFGWDL